jgi:aspartate oxidase
MGENLKWIKHSPSLVKAGPVGALASEVQTIIGKYLGILRWEKGLKTCLSKLNDCADLLEAMKRQNVIVPRQFFKIQNMILTGKEIVNASLTRKASLGGHFREDFPPDLGFFSNDRRCEPSY